MAQNFFIEGTQDNIVNIQDLIWIGFITLLLALIPFITYLILCFLWRKSKDNQSQLSSIKNFLGIFHLIITSLWYIWFVVKKELFEGELLIIIILGSIIYYLYQKHYKDTTTILLKRYIQIHLSLLLSWFIINSTIMWMLWSCLCG